MKHDIRAADVLTRGEHFRVHGNGFIQVDMPEGLRVNIWGHPDIPRQVNSTQIHNHRFSFRSTILHGKLVNSTYEAFKRKVGTHDAYRAVPRDGEDTEMVFDHSLWVIPKSIILIERMQVYHLEKYVFHETFVNCPTVTLMQKVDVDPDYEPFVLSPAGMPVDNEFSRYKSASVDDLRRITQQVFAYWGDVYQL